VSDVAEDPGASGYEITTEPSRVDIEAVARWLGTSYWAEHRPRHIVERSIANSMCFSAGDGERPAGFARFVTDRATFAWICDVVVDPVDRGRGLGKRLVEAILEHPDLVGLRRFLLATLDAHGLYTKYGFTPLVRPTRWLERFDDSTESEAGRSAP
jgi:GNAT superfamily N-acetyltransferase